VRRAPKVNGCLLSYFLFLKIKNEEEEKRRKKKRRGGRREKEISLAAGFTTAPAAIR
jgi:hypothetical protein